MMKKQLLEISPLASLKNNLYMKKIVKFLFIAIGFLVVNNVSAQSKSNTEEIMVNGFKVLYKPTNNQIVSARFFIKGGTANYAKEQEGIESVALDIATNGGSANYPKEKFYSQLDKMGSSIEGTSGLDAGNILMICLQKNFNATWDIFQDVINAPLMPEEEFQKSKEGGIANSKQSISNPDDYLTEMAMTDAFANLNYDKKPNGSEESLNKLTLELVKKHFEKIISKKQCFLVVIGKIDRKDLIEKVKKLTEKMPEGNFVAPKTKLLSIAQSTIKVEDRKLATNYIRGIMNAPAYGTSETYAMQIAFGILADHLFDEIRTKRSLSYAPSASYSTNINPYSNIYVSTTDPKQAVSVMIDELKKLKKEGFSEKEIKDQKSGYLTAYYMGLETNSAQTLGLGMAEVKGNWKNFNSFIENINKVSPKEVNTVFNKYIEGIRWSYLGDLSKVNSEIFLQKL